MALFKVTKPRKTKAPEPVAVPLTPREIATAKRKAVRLHTVERRKASVLRKTHRQVARRAKRSAHHKAMRDRRMQAN